jgi:hypothetical protein
VVHNDTRSKKYQNYSGDQIRKMRWAEHVALVGEKKKDACSILVGNPEGKGQHGKPRRKWEFNN